MEIIKKINLNKKIKNIMPENLSSFESLARGGCYRIARDANNLALELMDAVGLLLPTLGLEDLIRVAKSLRRRLNWDERQRLMVLSHDLQRCNTDFTYTDPDILRADLNEAWIKLRLVKVTLELSQE